MLCLQLDDLDSLRASHGLEAQEAILRVVAHTLRNGIDPQDFVGRWSDDQFLAILAIDGPGELAATAERLKKLAGSSEIVWWGDELSLTVSVGGTVLVPIESVESLLDRIGSALMEATSQGGNVAVILDAPDGH
jgi:diguanylate cyclase (GGDEF)-like protein